VVGLKKLYAEVPSETKDQSLANRVVKIIDPEMTRVLNLTGQNASIGETVLDLTPQLEADGDDVFLYLKLGYSSGSIVVTADIYPTNNPNNYDYSCMVNNAFMLNSITAIIKTDSSGQIHYRANLIGVGTYTLQVFVIGVATDIPDHKHDI
jgi:hypothetical protein